MTIYWSIEEGWHECTVGDNGKNDTTVSISPDGGEIHIYGILYQDEFNEVKTKVEELQGEVK